MIKIFYYILFLILFTSCGAGELIDKEKSDSYFFSFTKGVVYCSNGSWFELGIQKCNADKKTFEVISERFAKDKDYVYYCETKQKHVDISTFQFIDEIPRDKNYAYKIVGNTNLISKRVINKLDYSFLFQDKFSLHSRRYGRKI